MAYFHTQVSPSSLERVLLCPASVGLCKDIPPSRPSEFAAQGTVFHRLAAMCLKYGVEPYDFEGITAVADGFEIEVDDDMMDYLVDGLDRLEALGPRNMIIETRVYLDKWFPGQSGTTDIGWYDDEWINIWDWKYGAGIPVSPFRNPQAMAYGLGFWDNIARLKTNAKKFRFFIEQPRNPAGGGEWECSLDELLTWAKESARIVSGALKGKGKFNPGEKQCTFCPARAKCPAYDQFALEAMSLKFEKFDSETPPVLEKGMNARRRAYVARYASFLKDWIDLQHSTVLDDAMKGRDTFQVKAVWGRMPPRKWSDPAAAQSRLSKLLGSENAVKAKVITVKEAENKLTAEDFDRIQKFIAYKDPKPVLVPVEDKRDRVKSYADAFEKYED